MNTDRKVTERDFRRPEFSTAEPEDYEFRSDGEVARKDRWEQGIRAIVGELSELDGAGLSRQKFEIDDVVKVVRSIAKAYAFNTEEIKNER